MLDKKQIQHIANLARLELSEEEEEKYGRQLSDILDYIDKLKEVDTSKVAITAQVSGLHNSWREDEVKDWDKEEIAMALAQGDLVNGQVKVKKVL
jgi:aspartyl-tRNA(Asn)/glutamyl-tRNA(Gln) amidotransferase subunit C